jgi:thiol-disulfide isomerase/thioredoxin
MFRLINSLFLFLLIIGTASANTLQEDASSPWFEHDARGNTQVNLYFYWSTRCAHCKRALPFVEFIDQAYPWVKLKSFQLVGDKENVRQFQAMAKTMGQEARSVPTFVFCNTMMTGFDVNETPNQLIEGLKHCHDYLKEHRDLQGYAPLYGTSSGATLDVELPVFGKIYPDEHGLVFITMAIAAVDAFNPCAFFVLLFLLSMMLHLGSRRRMILVGVIFVSFSGLIYFLFMSAWLNLFRMIGQLEVITTVAALIAMTIGLINMKDFFWFKKGMSLSIPEQARPGLYQRTRNLLQNKSIYALIGATIGLSFFANLYELLCTAGFPMVYTRVLTLNNLETHQYYLYLGLYNLIYVLPLMVIVLVFIGSLGGRKLQQQEGRSLKLISGMMMFALGVLLLVAPGLLNNLFVILVIMLTVIGLALMLIMIDKKRNFPPTIP